VPLTTTAAPVGPRDHDRCADRAVVGAHSTVTGVLSAVNATSLTASVER
jgi:hypothetical protein